MMEANQNSRSITAQLVNDLAAAVICTDLCTTCNGDLGEDQKLVLVKLPVKRGEQTYPYIAITSCSRCAEEKDYNKMKRGLNYWLSEGKLEVLKDV